MYFRIRPQLAWQRIGEHVVVVDLASNRLYGLAPEAGALFEAVAQGGWAQPKEPEREGDWWLLVEAGWFEASPVVDAQQGTRVLSTPDKLHGAPLWQWQEPLSTFAKACLFIPGQSELCNVSPAS